MPPALETWNLDAADGKLATYTSGLLLSSETYATHFPSGANCAWRTLTAVSANGVARPPVSTMRLLPTRYSKWRPSGDESTGMPSIFDTGCSAPRPLGGLATIARAPDRLVENTTLPSRDQIG